MTYTNDYRLGRRAYHPHQEESLAFVLAVVVVIAIAIGFYILWDRFHIRLAQLVELSLYALYGLTAGISIVWYFATLRRRREANWPHPPFFIAQAKDRKAVAEAIRGKTIKGTLFGDATFLPNGQLQPRYVVFKVVDGKTAKLEALP